MLELPEVEVLRKDLEKEVVGKRVKDVLVETAGIVKPFHRTRPDFVKALEGRRACLMAHHGVIAGHINIAKALSLAVTVEELAHQYLLLLPNGEPPVLSSAQIAEVLEKFKTYGQQSKSAEATLRKAS